ncbi:MAG: FKBP-type peptidyl-prolyl cis-trans isomerase [bacterium]|jgi:FKBP-type peptidyl-prolyl cis-trans isomerase 2|nr:FKBP-type peptidyl-prolyl cis-trans isomerase [bacterium]
MSKAEMGDAVRVYYTAIRENETIAEGTPEGEPFEFSVGDPEVREMFTRIVLGMEEGDKRSVTLQPKDAFGLYLPEYVVEVGRDKFPPDVLLEIGTRMEVQADPGGTPLDVTVKSVTDQIVVLDANHALAGETIVLTVQLVEMIDWA